MGRPLAARAEAEPAVDVVQDVEAIGEEGRLVPQLEEHPAAAIDPVERDQPAGQARSFIVDDAGPGVVGLTCPELNATRGDAAVGQVRAAKRGR
jgi:hypothetical protein